MIAFVLKVVSERSAFILCWFWVCSAYAHLPCCCYICSIFTQENFPELVQAADERCTKFGRMVSIGSMWVAVYWGSIIATFMSAAVINIHAHIYTNMWPKEILRHIYRAFKITLSVIAAICWCVVTFVVCQ